MTKVMSVTVRVSNTGWHGISSIQNFTAVYKTVGKPCACMQGLQYCVFMPICDYVSVVLCRN